MPIKATNGNGKNPPPPKKITKASKKFVDAAAMPGMTPSGALRVMNASAGDPKHGTPGNHDHIIAYKKSRYLRDYIEERKQLALQFCDITPEMVLGATAMRAFGSPDGAFDENGRFDMKLARASGAIHLLKKLKSTPNGLEAEFYSNESAQTQLANYLGMEFAPKNNEDTSSLKAGIEAVAKAIAAERHTEVTHEIRVEAWERVNRWVRDSKARYSAQAMEEAEKLYGKVIEVEVAT